MAANSALLWQKFILTETDKMDNVYSEIKLEKLPKMRIAKHTVVSPTPEEDVSNYMDNWAKESGLADLKDYVPRSFGWDADVGEKDKENNPDFVDMRNA